MEYKMVSEINAPTRINRFLVLRDVAIVAIFGVIGFVTKDFLNPNLQIYYFVFNLIVGLIMALPSPFSKGRKIYQLIIFTIARNRGVYHSLRGENKRVPKQSADMYFGYNVGGAKR